jgi:DNA polymerase I-like protein with 3'-5' exonuclease and polymerase domains
MAEIQGVVEMFQANYPSERCWPLLQVHDELLFELSRPIAEDFCGMAKSIMETAVTLDVPVKAEYGIGENWLEAHK